MKVLFKTLIAVCLILASCTLNTGMKTDFQPYADSCESCYDKLSHPIAPISHKKECSDSVMARIKYIDSVRTSIKRQWVETAQKALDLAKREENHTQAFLFEEQLYIANRYRTSADWHLCDSARLHYAKEMMQTAMLIEDADTIGIAITHYMDAMKHLGGKIDTDTILYKVRNLRGFVHNPDEYSKVLCFIARKYVAIGDDDNAKKFMAKALYISMKGRAEETEVSGRRAAQQLLDKGEIKEAIQTYFSVLQANESVVKEKTMARNTQKEASTIILRSFWLWALLLLIIACGIATLYYFHKKRKNESYSFQSEITALQEKIAHHEHKLQDMEKSETESKEEIIAQKKTIENLKHTIVERLSIGKTIYEELQKGNCMPYDIKGAESYLIDYYVIFVPEKYKKWNEEYEGLTPRMYTYLILMDMNYPDAEIRRILSISPSSLRALRSRTMAKKVRS